MNAREPLQAKSSAWERHPSLEPTGPSHHAGTFAAGRPLPPGPAGGRPRLWERRPRREWPGTLGSPRPIRDREVAPTGNPVHARLQKHLAALLAVLLLTAWSTAPHAQGFAGLGTEAEGFAVPEPGKAFTFPVDHGAHPDYRIEWWYLTANLRGGDGRDYGIQWTLFRSALAPGNGSGWQSPQAWMGHAAVTTEESHWFTERFGRGGIGQAGVQTHPFQAWIDEWALTSRAGSGQDALDRLRVTAGSPDFAYTLDLEAHGPLVFHGEDGYSVKSEAGQASYYYSQPFYRVSGTLDLPQGPVEVTGQAWLDREWSSQPLAETQEGWDWFSLHLDDGARLMGFRLRDTSGETFTSATWIGPDQTVETLPPGAFQAVPLGTTDVEGSDIPTHWQVSLPTKDLDVEIQPLNPKSWMGTRYPYWEGPVSITGSHRGRGYLEMTGYD